MDEIKKEAIYYWQDKLAKFWPTIKGPSTVEIAMFEAGYKLATEGTHSCYDECTNPGCSLRRENARLREALEDIASEYALQGDCVACDFGPSQSKTHRDDCPFVIARAALEDK